MSNMDNKHRWVWLFLASIFLFVSCSRGTAEDQPKEKGRATLPVTVSQVLSKDVPIQVTAVGNVEPYATVEVKSRISGDLMSIHFKEGQEVKEGDLLFAIDRRPFEIALKEAQARLERDQVLARKAQDDVRRNTPLLEKGLVSHQAYEQLKYTAEAAEASVKADQAAIENHLLQLNYCRIKAPISGRTGSILIQRGNLIKGNDENKFLVTINQIQPVFITFAVPEKFLDEINRAMGKRMLTVQASTSSSSPPNDPTKGTVTFVDNTVDMATGPIRLKATFPNQDRRLWPGQIVNVTLNLGIQTMAVVVPSQAIQNGQSGRYVFVVKEDKTVELRPVLITREMDGQVVIGKGLSPDETVVTDGQLRLTPGAKVSIKEKAVENKETEG
ncbi:MAG: efflux RND transporter periplasmic adaptor subunit [Pseudomonadota bacterium]